MNWKLPAAVGLLVIGGGAVYVAVAGVPGSGSSSSTEYLSAAAATADVAETVVATGALERATTYVLDFGVAPVVVPSGTTPSGTGSGTWTVQDVKVAEGDTVKKGAVLAQADTTSLRKSLIQANANLSAAKIQKLVAQTSLNDASGTDATRQAKIQLQNAIGGLEQARTAVSDLKAQIAHATLVAPADGTIQTVNITAGADASGGTAIIMAAGPLRVSADFAESDLPALKIGQPAGIKVTALGTTVDGKVVAVAPAASTSSGNSSVVTYPVTIELTDPPADARPGMSAEATITIASANGVLSIPAAALNGSAGDYQVLVLNADGSVVSRPVTVGLVTASLAEIQSGLQAGERVVTGTAASRNATTTGGGFGGGGVIRGAGGGGVRVPVQP